MKIINTIWFSEYAKEKPIGIILGEDETTKEKKVYIGTGQGIDEGEDTGHIVSCGSKFPLAIAKEVYNFLEGVTKNETKKDQFIINAQKEFEEILKSYKPHATVYLCEVCGHYWDTPVVCSNCGNKEFSKISKPSKEALFWIEQKLSEKKGRITAKIVCLCGSTRFTEQMLIKQWELTKQGFIVVTWCALPDSYFKTKDKFHIGDQENVKEIIDELHKRKIDLCDEVFVIDVDGYIGNSTRSEIDYALKVGRPVKYLSQLEKKNG